VSDFIFSVSVPSQEKKLGKKGDMAQFRAQLDSLGLKIVEVTADGNCFFRFSRTGFFWTLLYCHKKKKLTDFEQDTFLLKANGRSSAFSINRERSVTKHFKRF
jgi:hypothetical protein